MKITRALLLIGLFLTMVLFTTPNGWTQSQVRSQTGQEGRPIITNTFAVEKGYYGYIWKIYLEGEDPGGDMLRLALTVDQPGVGEYPTDWIYLKPQYRQHFKGYIQWNTFSSKASYLPEWTEITLRVSVFDKAGRQSNEVAFPFSFEITPGQYKYQLPSPFDQGDLPRLGYVGIDLYYPGMGGYNHMGD